MSRWRVLYQGRQSPDYQANGSLSFGPGQKHFAYTAMPATRQRARRSEMVVVDGKRTSLLYYSANGLFAPIRWLNADQLDAVLYPLSTSV